MSGERIWTQLEGHELLKKIFKEDGACKKKLRKMFTSNNTNASLQERWRRIVFGTKENQRDWKVCKSWEIKLDRKKGVLNFKAWFVRQYHEQNGRCHYCGLEGDVRENYKNQLDILQMEYFRKGTRGKCFEIERKEAKQEYNERNCVLACYPCNNAKSDVFTDKEFEIIGAVIGALKTNRKNLESNNFIKGLIKNVKKTANRKI